MRFRAMFAALAALSLAPLAACSEQADSAKDDAAVPSRSLAEAIDSQGELSKFADALEQTGLEGIFEGPGDYTVLAPENQAVEKLGETGERLMQEDQRPVLAAILRRHILPGTILPEDIKKSLAKEEGNTVIMATMGSNAMTFTLEDGRIVATTGEGWRGVLSDSAIRASNGVVIPVDAVQQEAVETAT
jgi:uncharacterized surface protein with fasciclin (FAS1) repeats